MAKNSFQTNRAGVIKPSTKPDTEKVKVTSITGKDLRTGK